MTDFWDLMLAHRGKRICVMGGAPRLADDLAAVNADIYISTNAHGADLRQPDYVLAMDEEHSGKRVPMQRWIRERTDAPIIGPHPWADYQLITWPMAPRFVLSGMVAVWAAYMMGAKVVIVAGMDGYGDAVKNRDEPRKMQRDVYCPVRVANGGPLTRTWPQYDPTERFGRYTPHPAIQGWLGIDEPITVRVRKPTVIRRVEREAGYEIKVMRHEVARQLRHRMVEQV